TIPVRYCLQHRQNRLLTECSLVLWPALRTPADKHLARPAANPAPAPLRQPAPIARRVQPGVSVSACKPQQAAEPAPVYARLARWKTIRPCLATDSSAAPESPV